MSLKIFVRTVTFYGILKWGSYINICFLLQWHKKRDESLAHGFMRYSPLDDCSERFSDCPHNRSQTHYHCIQDGCDKVRIIINSINSFNIIKFSIVSTSAYPVGSIRRDSLMLYKFYTVFIISKNLFFIIYIWDLSNLPRLIVIMKEMFILTCILLKFAVIYSEMLGISYTLLYRLLWFILRKQNMNKHQWSQWWY